MQRIFTNALIFLSLSASAQSYNITGSVHDQTDGSTLIGVNVLVFPAGDSTQKTGGITDVDGNFNIPNLNPGSYKIRASYVGFQNYERAITLTSDVNLGTISLKPTSTQLKGVEVAAQQIAAQQSGDTSNFNAGAYKTNPDANAEDLINKMPGISTDGGTVKAQGEDVKQVLVDGKPFFGDDPNAAIKNLPAEIIDRIQVFDKLSDQAQLTGVDDGQSQKTINIITKPGKNNGQFGKIFGGYGTDGRYLAGGSVNYFKGDTRVSLIGLFNNVNQQNFSTDDLLGVINTSSGQGRGGSGGSFRGGRGGGGTRGGGSPGGFSGGGNYRGGGTDVGSFLVGQQGGISTTNSIGINYSDNWGKKVQVTGSYFFNSTRNENNTDLSRTYFSTNDSDLIYKEQTAATSTNTNHRANLRLEYTIDSSNSLIITPRISFQNNNSDRSTMGITRLQDSSFVSSTDNINSSKNKGYNFNNNLLYVHKFAKRGRTISLNAATALNDRTGRGDLLSTDLYATDLSGGTPTDTVDQQYTTSSSGYTLSGSLNYTEPLGKMSQLMVNYSPSYNHTISERNTTNADNTRDTALSNNFDNSYTTQRGGLTYRTNTLKSNFSVGINYQYATLNGQETFPSPLTVNRTFNSILPMVMYNYRFTRTKNLRLMYRANTNPPSINQLQNVLDNTNPLLLRTGNADLQQDYTHTMMLRYGATNTSTSRNFFAVAFASFTQNYIGNATYFAVTADTMVDNILVRRGAQLTKPVNLDGYRSARTFFTYGLPVKAIKSNLNLNLGLNYNRIPALINGETNLSNNYTMNGGFVLGSNISENVDFTLSYNGNYNIVKNSIQSQSDNSYYYQTTSLRFNWIFLNGVIFNTNVNHNLYTGLGQGFNQSYFLWNASLGYKFLKDKSLDIRVSAYDLLNQNRAIDRTVTESYIEDSHTEVLQRYFMLNITYTLRRFAGSAPPAPSGDGFERSGRRGMRGGDGTPPSGYR